MSDSLNGKSFSLDTIEETFTIGGKTYTLKEASGGAVVTYRDAMMAGTQLGPDGKPRSVRGMAATEPLLVSLCLYDEGGKLVPETVVRSWPNRIQKALYDRIKQISDMDQGEDEDAEDELGNLPGDTMDGSD